MGQPWPLFRIFLFFQTHITIFATNKCEKFPSRIHCRDLNLRPLEHDSPPITTRPGLPPILVDVWEVVVTQLPEQLLLTLEVCSSNQATRKIFKWTCLLLTVQQTKIKKKRPGMAH